MSMAPAPPPPAAPALVRSVAITDLTVIPSSVVVPPGGRVTWANAGHNRHTATSDTGAFDSGTLFPGARLTISAPATPGVYAYHCVFHSFIRGTVVVSPVSLETPAPVGVGRSARLYGTVPGAAAGTQVVLQRRVAGAWEVVATPVTDAQGAFSARSPGLVTRTAFRAMAGESVSPSVRAEVRPAVVLTRAGRRLRVRVTPAGAGGALGLQRLDLDTYRWRTVARTGLPASGRTSFSLSAAGVYRVRVAPHAGLSPVASPTVQFQPWRFH